MLDSERRAVFNAERARGGLSVVMSPPVARVCLHTMHLLTFTALFVTGLLLFVPGLRAALVGGYSLLIRDVHRWGGVAFLVFPALLIIRCGPRTVFTPPAERNARSLWQGFHVVVTVAMGLVFTLTGFALWGRRSLPELLVDSSRLVHDWLTYVAAVLVAAHLAEIGIAAMAARVSAGATASR